MILTTIICEPIIILEPPEILYFRCSRAKPNKNKSGNNAGYINREPVKFPLNSAIMLRCIPHPGHSMLKYFTEGQVSIFASSHLIHDTYNVTKGAINLALFNRILTRYHKLTNELVNIIS